MSRNTDLLKTYGLSRNPFIDRTAEKTVMDNPLSLYVHSDLKGFKPTATTYVFFGKRGSGKTTIRLQMEDVYLAYNTQAISSSRSQGSFIVDLCKPGHMTTCLTTFQETIGASIDNWDAAFSDQWKTSDLVDCILSYAATDLVKSITKGDDRSKQMLDALKGDPKRCRQFLLLIHLYSKTDASALQMLRRTLLRPKRSVAQVSLAVGAGVTVATGAVALALDPRVYSAVTEHGGPIVGAVADKVAETVPVLKSHPGVVAAAAALVASAGLAYHLWRQQTPSFDRVVNIQRIIRVVKPQPQPTIGALLEHMFTPEDTAETIRQLCIGISAHQKLDLLTGLMQLLGHENVAIFGDCFDEVTLLDPVRFPGAMKAFAKEVCRNDVLNFGRLHFFFPDSRLALDLSTDRTLKEARFDRHFVRDLAWSRHQLEELAERRFRAAQEALEEENGDDKRGGKAAKGRGGGQGRGGHHLCGPLQKGPW